MIPDRSCSTRGDAWFVYRVSHPQHRREKYGSLLCRRRQQQQRLPASPPAAGTAAGRSWPVRDAPVRGSLRIGNARTPQTASRTPRNLSGTFAVNFWCLSTPHEKCFILDSAFGRQRQPFFSLGNENNSWDFISRISLVLTSSRRNPVHNIYYPLTLPNPQRCTRS